MEKSRKNLKIYSVIILLFAGLTLLSLVAELWLGELNNAEIPEGAPENILSITRVFVLVVSFVLLLPRLYVGFKGLKMAKNPDSSNGHIVWGMILLVISVIGLISPITALAESKNIFDGVMELLGVIVDVVVFYGYVKYAKAVSKGN